MSSPSPQQPVELVATDIQVESANDTEVSLERIFSVACM